jgi:dipeptidyl aminopeptidase/acylaminoacyl peptidase
MWVAEMQRQAGSGEFDQVRFVVQKANRSVIWTVFDRAQRKGLGQELPTPQKWSSDGRYLYFSNTATPDGCALFTFVPDLYRLDLHTGSLTEILKPVAWNLALSPDERWLAYFSQGKLIVRDLVNGQERQSALQVTQPKAWNIVWSPNASRLVYKQTQSDGFCDTSQVALIHFDVETLVQKTLLGKTEMEIVGWEDPDRILLKDKDRKFYWLDANTGALQLALEITPMR